MKFTWDIALVIFLIHFFGYIIKWVIGFGNPLVSAPLLSMRLDNALITPGSLVPDFCINTYISWKSRKLLDLRQILPLLIVLLAGVIPGTWLLRFSMPWVIKTVLGIVVLFFAAKAIYPLTTPAMIGDFKACGGFLLIATGCRIAKIQDFPVADMIPAMVLVMPLSALWVNCIVPLL